MQDTYYPQKDIRDLLISQKFAVFSTQETEHPYLNLVAFAETHDLRTILFATTRSTRKYENLVSKPGVSLLVDNRSNDAADIHEAKALTIIGTASEVPLAQRPTLDTAYLHKQPHMKDFLESHSTALIKVDVASYILVCHFQEVTTLDLTSTSSA